MVYRFFYQCLWFLDVCKAGHHGTRSGSASILETCLKAQYILVGHAKGSLDCTGISRRGCLLLANAPSPRSFAASQLQTSAPAPTHRQRTEGSSKPSNSDFFVELKRGPVSTFARILFQLCLVCLASRGSVRTAFTTGVSEIQATI